MNARTRKRAVGRLMWGDSRRCPIGRHAYVMEQNAWVEDGVVRNATRWKCWACGHWQTSPPIGSFCHGMAQRVREYAAKNPEEYAQVIATMAGQTQEGQEP